MTAVCGAARTKSGGQPCQKPAGWGGPTPGFGPCRFHGAMAPNHRQASAAAMARAHVATLIGPIELEPHEALQLAIALTGAEVGFFSERIAELGITDIAGQATVSTTRRGAASAEGEDEPGDVVEVRQLAPSLHIWVKARADAIDRLARFAKMALDAGVDERRVRVQEVQLDRLAAVVNAVMRDLTKAGLSDELRMAAGESFKRHRGLLEAVNGTAHEVAA
jgi:hypothetical protein